MDECRDILQNGIFDDHDLTNRNSFKSKLKQWLLNLTYNQVKEMKGGGLSFNIPIVIEDIPTPFEFDLDGNYSEDEFKQFQSFLSQGTIKDFESDSYYNTTSHTVNPLIVKAWIDCMKLSSSQPPVPQPPVQLPGPPPIEEFQPGLKSSLTEYDEHTLIFKTWYVPFGANDPYPKVLDFKVLGGTYNNFSVGDSISYPKNIIIKRTGHEPLLITLTTDKGETTNQLPATKPPQLVMKHFVYEEVFTITNGYQKVFQVPEQFKIIGAGWYNSDNLLGKKYVYPKSAREWIVEIPKNIQGNGHFWLSLITIHDPEDQWDVKIFEQSVSNQKSVDVQVSEDYSLTCGGAAFYPQIPEDVIQSVCNMSGLRSSYPKDEKTWSVTISNECDAEQFPSWQLKAFAIGLKSKNNEKFLRLVSTSNETNRYDVYLEQKDYEITGGGIKLEIQAANLHADFGHCDSIYPYFYWTNPEIPPFKGWIIRDIISPTNVNNITRYALGIKHPDLDVLYLPLEFHTDQS
ncbi:hypothetical protein ACTFO4_25505 [Bacillus cereus group sp. MYBKT14-1]|uniref:hypothetical protein n=1 Tax=unclassified Bacillus cereus group TaxID=2750818 RepID=UPI002999E38C|nr:hypothetical protein [Bacillus cereus]HDR4871998.1 hypothetical protein [Bacillus cereus]